MTVKKDQIIAAFQKTLPNEVQETDLLETFRFLQNLQEGIDDSNAGKTFPEEFVWKKFGIQ